MSIDDKLKNLQTHCEDCGFATVLSENCIERIKRAFAEEGYSKRSTITINDPGSKPINEFMTGQEFYDRFVKEFNYLVKGHWYFDDKTLVADIEKAAKKAAGL